MRKLHQTIKKVTDDIAALVYNGDRRDDGVHQYAPQRRTAPIAPRWSSGAARRPFAPHLAEERGTSRHSVSVMDSGWPAYDAELAREELVELAVQVNGKLRGTIQVPPNVGQEEALAAARADAGIAKHVTGDLKKVVFVPGRLLSLVQ